MSSLFNETTLSYTMVGEIEKSINKKKEEILLQRIKENGIIINLEQEESRRFRSFKREVQEGMEIIYFNDGSVNGLRLVTFVVETKYGIDNKFSVSYELSYF